VIDIAVVEVSATKRMSALVNYAANPKKVGVISTLNMVNSNNASQVRREMYNTRKSYNKNGGRQGFHIIQSFEGWECSVEEANRIGRELAQKIAGDFECVIYTHVNTKNVHNHIVINSVSFRNGKKFHQTNYKSGKSKPGSVNLVQIKQESDKLCRENGLTVVNKPTKVRKSMAERQLEARGEKSWKIDLRAAIDEAKISTTNFAEFKNKLEKEGIKVNERGKNISFQYPGQKHNIRGKTLGEAYTTAEITKSLSKEKIIPGQAFEKIKELRLQMKAENDPAKKAELQKQFDKAKETLNKERELLTQQYKTQGRERGYERSR